MILAPVLLFVYKRPEHTRKTLEALQNNFNSSEISLFIYADGLKEGATQEQIEDHAKVKEIIFKQDWCKSLTIKESKNNLGLANSIIQGITEVINKYDKVIVLEDDIITSRTFFQFMNMGLDKYDKHQSVSCISGYLYPIKGKIKDVFFMRGADCWGWATWKRAWDKFNPDAKYLLSEIQRKGLVHDFNINGSYAYDEMLKSQINKNIDSWAIRWYASAFLNSMHTLYPPKSLVVNIGIDGSGTHSGDSDFLKTGNEDYLPLQLPDIVQENILMKRRIAEYFMSFRSSQNHKRIVEKLIRNFKTWFKK